MLVTSLLSLGIFMQSASAHYVFNALIHGTEVISSAVRLPSSNSPVHDLSSDDIRCNVNPRPATSVVTVAPGDTIGFTLDSAIYHNGPAALYLGKAPSSVADWDGSGQHWFKIAEWGAEISSDRRTIVWPALNALRLTATIPENTPPGEYLLRAEQIGLHNIPPPNGPEFFISCAQIKVIGEGSGTPPTVSIPGYVHPNDPGLNYDIYTSPFADYKVPGPDVWDGTTYYRPSFKFASEVSEPKMVCFDLGSYTFL